MAFNANATNGSVVYVPGTRSTQILTADTSVATDTTLSEETGLTIKLGKYERIAFRYNIFFSTTANADFKYLVDVPAAITLYRLAATGVDTDAGEISTAPITAEGSEIALTANGTEGYLGLEGVLENGSAIDSLKFTWAQNTSHADNTIVRRGSNVEFIRF